MFGSCRKTIIEAYGTRSFDVQQSMSDPLSKKIQAEKTDIGK